MGKEFEKYANKQIELATMHHEVSAVGAGIGGGFEDTSELKPMKYKQAMMTKDKEQWVKVVDDEYNRWLVNFTVVDDVENAAADEEYFPIAKNAIHKTRMSRRSW